MELKHTPGPWSVGTLPFDGAHVAKLGPAYITAPHHTKLASADCDAAAISATPEALALAQDFLIKGPDDDGLLWLVVKGKATFNLGSADGIVGQAAVELEADRQAVLQKASGK